MLTNLGALSLPRIHNMLKMFVAEVCAGAGRAARAARGVTGRPVRPSPPEHARAPRPAPCPARPPSPLQPVKYDKSEAQLSALLMALVEEDKLDYSDGKFSLKPQQ